MIGHTPLSLCGARNCGKPLNECSFMCEWEKSEGGSVCVCVCVLVCARVRVRVCVSWGGGG